MARNRNQAVKRARELSKQRKIEDKRAKKQQKRSGGPAIDAPHVGDSRGPATEAPGPSDEQPVNASA